jgi:outer membrane protein OmpA-like peptidoglycan-associated protein
MHLFASKQSAHTQPPTTLSRLTISSPSDRYEQDAEHLANQVAGPIGNNMKGTAISSMPNDAPLPDDVRSYFEPRFGHDFSRVRVHTDTRAARSAQALGAQAYTLGNDVVLGTGQYAPQTGEGRRLLAHELAHVVQQGSGSVAPMIQRRLLMTGSKADIKGAFELLEPASGFTLKYDPKTHEVSIVASVLKPQSFVLASELFTIMSDPARDAEIHLGRDQAGVSFGAFPPNSQALEDKPVQEIRIDQMLALEKDAPGAGVAKLAHEIVENYTAHDPQVQAFSWEVAFSESHSKALEAEDSIEAELGHPGPRRNTFNVEMGRGKSRKLLEIEDRETYFLVLDKGSKGKVSNARRVGRLKVSTHKITGFGAGSDNLPSASTDTIAALATEMKNNPTASVLLEGFASGGKSTQADARLAEHRASEVQDAVIKKAKATVEVSWHRFHILGNQGSARNDVVVTLERPDI